MGRKERQKGLGQKRKFVVNGKSVNSLDRSVKQREAEEEKKRVFDNDEKAPKSFVIQRRGLPPAMTELMEDLKDVLLPYSSKKLHSTRKQHIKDFVEAAHVLRVTHLQILSQGDDFPYWRIGRLPNGPMIVLRIDSFTTGRETRAADDASHLGYYNMFDALSKPPLPICCGFNKPAEVDPRVEVMQSVFKGLFPSVDVERVRLADCKRAVYFHYLGNCKVAIRHYLVKTADNKQQQVDLSLLEIGPRIDATLIEILDQIPITKDNRKKVREPKFTELKLLKATQNQ